MKRTVVAMAALLAACAGDPVQPPPVPTAAPYTAAPVALQGSAAGVHGGQPQRFAPGHDMPALWWTLFRSPALDALVRQALDGSPTLMRAQARLRRAQEDFSARSGATRLPQVNARASANRIDVDPQAIGVGLPLNTPFNLYLASVGVSYTFDLFGANAQRAGRAAGRDSTTSSSSSRPRA